MKTSTINAGRLRARLEAAGLTLKVVGLTDISQDMSIQFAVMSAFILQKTSDKASCTTLLAFPT